MDRIGENTIDKILFDIAIILIKTNFLINVRFDVFVEPEHTQKGFIF